MTRHRWALALVAGAAVLLAACSSNSTTPKKVTTTTRHAATSNDVVVDHHDDCGRDDDVATAASTACTHVTASPGQGQGAAGTITGMITVTNTGTASCTANGYPTVALFSGSGAPLTVTMVDGLSVTISSAANAPPSTVTVAPSSSAQFAYQYSDVPVGSETSCPTSESASVTMPGSTTASSTFQLAIGPCSSGTIRVSPVYAGS